MIILMDFDINIDFITLFIANLLIYLDILKETLLRCFKKMLYKIFKKKIYKIYKRNTL